MYDLLVKNGRIVDGTGAPAYSADVAVRQGEIVAVGEVGVDAAKIIDAKGLIVSPGFVDPHTHSDVNFLFDPTAQSKIRQGVTVELTGNCGMSFAPLLGEAHSILRSHMARYTSTFKQTWQDFAGYLEAIEKNRATLNLATQVGHNTIRACVLGLEDRAPSRTEMEQMKSLLEKSLDAGALGFSTGLFHALGSYARPEEIIELCKVVAERGKLYSTHIRDEGTRSVGLLVALNEALEVGRRTSVRVEISHVKCFGQSVWGRTQDILELLTRARKEGIDVAGDQYPYSAANAPLAGMLFPDWAVAGGREVTLKRFQDPSQRKLIHDDILLTYDRTCEPVATVIANFPINRKYEGMNMTQIADGMRSDVAEAAMRLYEEGEGMVIMHAMKETDVELIAQHPLIAVGSDGGSLSAEGVLSSGKPHPRNFGTYPRYLARFVREKKLVSLEEAIRKMTLLPASRLGLTRRGRTAPGYWADLVIFDSNTVEDTATFSEPHNYPKGIRYVIVNGVPVIENGEFTRKTPGRVLRKFMD